MSLSCKTKSQVLLTGIYRCYLGAREEHTEFGLEKLESAYRPVDKAGRKDFKEKQQEVQRPAIYFVYPKYTLGVPRR